MKKNKNKFVVDNNFFLNLKKVKNNYILFKKLLSAYIKQFKIDLKNEDKNKYYKKLYNELLESDKKVLNSRKLYDLKKFYFVILRKYFQLENIEKRDLEFVIKELYNSYEIIKWWEFKEKLESISFDKYFNKKIDKIFINNILQHRGNVYIPFYELTKNDKILLLFENIDFDYLKIWEFLKSKLKARNEKDENSEYYFSYLSIFFTFKIVGDAIECEMTLFVENEFIHDYTQEFDEIFYKKIPTEEIVEKGKIDYKKILSEANKIANKNINKVILNEIKKYNEKLKVEEKLKDKLELEKFRIEQELKNKLELEKFKIEQLTKLLKEKVITYKEYIEAIKNIK